MLMTPPRPQAHTASGGEAEPGPIAPQQRREPRVHTQLPLWVPSWEPPRWLCPTETAGEPAGLDPWASGHLIVMRSGEGLAATSRVSPPCSVQGVVPTSAAALFICRA